MVFKPHFKPVYEAWCQTHKLLILFKHLTSGFRRLYTKMTQCYATSAFTACVIIYIRINCMTLKTPQIMGLLPEEFHQQMAWSVLSYNL